MHDINEGILQDVFFPIFFNSLENLENISKKLSLSAKKEIFIKKMEKLKWVHGAAQIADNLELKGKAVQVCTHEILF